MVRSPKMQHACLLCVLTSIVLGGPSDDSRALPPAQPPDDARLGPLRTLNDYFPFKPVASVDEWNTRAAQVRRHVLIATGLWPMPTRGPLNAVVHGKVERDDFSVERVYFESFPGHFVTGSLFRPKPGQDGRVLTKLPVALCPHGHWPQGRFTDSGDDGVRMQIAEGAERFEASGRTLLQARCVQLARMGCIVFHYDMVGYADSIQIPHHPHADDYKNGKPPTSGFASPAADLRLQSTLGLQTWNSIRALDFMLSLPDADPTRVLVTGESGGGTQTLMLTAVDDRVTLSVPAVMTSTAMQGGCSCENASYLRIGQGNIDIAALAAPRPLACIAANDWTREMPTKGFPDLQNLYKMLGIPDRVALGAFIQFEHNYNAVSRMFMYNSVNKHFKLGLKEPVIERDFQPLSVAELTVWDQSHPKPSGDQIGDAHEKKLLAWMSADSDRQIEAIKANPQEFRRVVGGAWDGIIGRRIEDVGPVAYDKPYQKFDRGDYLLMTSIITATRHHEQVPVLFLHPKQNWNKQVVIWLSDEGKAGLLGADGRPIPEIAKLVKAGYSVAGLDMLGQGEATQDGKPWTAARIYAKDANGKGWYWQHPGLYVFGYNRPLFCQRVHDVLTLTHFVLTHEQHIPTNVYLAGVGKIAGPVAAAARLQSGPAIAKAAIDTAGFRFVSLMDFDDPMYVPGAVKYGDVDALLALNAPNAVVRVDQGKPALIPQLFQSIQEPEK